MYRSWYMTDNYFLIHWLDNSHFCLPFSFSHFQIIYIINIAKNFSNNKSPYINLFLICWISIFIRICIDFESQAGLVSAYLTPFCNPSSTNWFWQRMLHRQKSSIRHLANYKIFINIFLHFSAHLWDDFRLLKWLENPVNLHVSEVCDMINL